LPVGLGLITLTLFALAVINVLTKKVATISGLTFTAAFFVVFELSERYHQKRKAGQEQETEKFRLDCPEELSTNSVNVRPGNVLVAVRNPHRLDHLKKVLDKTDASKLDIVVVSVRSVTQAGSGEHGLDRDQIFARDDTEGLR